MAIFKFNDQEIEINSTNDVIEYLNNKEKPEIASALFDWVLNEEFERLFPTNKQLLSFINLVPDSYVHQLLDHILIADPYQFDRLFPRYYVMNSPKGDLGLFDVLKQIEVDEYAGRLFSAAKEKLDVNYKDLVTSAKALVAVISCIPSYLVEEFLVYILTKPGEIKRLFPKKDDLIDTLQKMPWGIAQMVLDVVVKEITREIDPLFLNQSDLIKIIDLISEGNPFIKKELEEILRQRDSQAEENEYVELDEEEKKLEAQSKEFITSLTETEEKLNKFIRENQTDLSAEEYAKRAKEHEVAKEFEQAAEDYESALNMQKNAQWLDELGDIYVKLRNHQKAIANYTAVIQLTSPKNQFDLEQLYNKRAASYVKLKQFAEAIKDITAQIKMNPQSGNLYIHRARIYNKWGKAEEAKKDLDTVIQLKMRKNIFFYKEYAKSLNSLSDYYPVIGACTQVIAENKGLKLPASIYIQLAHAYNVVRNYEEALKSCNEALSIKPNSPKALYERAFAYNQLDKKKLKAAGVIFNSIYEYLIKKEKAEKGSRFKILSKLSLVEQKCHDFGHLCKDEEGTLMERIQNHIESAKENFSSSKEYMNYLLELGKINSETALQYALFEFMQFVKSRKNIDEDKNSLVFELLTGAKPLAPKDPETVVNTESSVRQSKAKFFNSREMSDLPKKSNMVGPLLEFKG